MAFFSKKKSKKKKKEQKQESAVERPRRNTNGNAAAAAAAASNAANTSNSKPSASAAKGKSSKRKSTKQRDIEVEPNMEMLPQLVKDLERSKETSGDKPARALRQLFSLSEHAADTENRTVMVRKANGRLVPTLLQFLRRCERGSSEQYLALLVLNNISIPSDNKRFIAIDCGGAQLFSQLLCEDPSCHLMAIILVNLTFADAEMRKELVSPHSNIDILHALSYALRVASLTAEEFDARAHLPQGDETGPYTPRVLLAALLEEDNRLRPALSDLDYNSGQNFRGRDVLFDPAKQIYPETARWCLAALKNLTRPSKDHTATQSLTNTGIVPFIMRFVTIAGSMAMNSHHMFEISENEESPSTSTETPPGVDPTQLTSEEFTNAPTTWDSNSLQDAALFVALNLCASPTSREYMHEIDAVNTLSLITEFRQTETDGHRVQMMDEQKLADFQCVKARMALAFLVGSTGNFGQPRKRRAGTSNVSLNSDDSVLLIRDSEAELLVELLANTLHQRAKEGPGGYSAATFNVRGVIYAIRCLLTHHLNQITFVTMTDVNLNVLLMKVLAMHAIQNAPSIDAEAAEHACWSLYLQSNYGFQSPFLPATFGDHDKIAGKGSLAEKVLTSYLHMESITPAGRHAADQISLRLRYLEFKGSVTSPARKEPVQSADLTFDGELMDALETIIVEKRSHGTRPRLDIFDRPILRSRAPKKSGTHRAPWENRANVRVFPSALHAVQELSFGSTRVRHMDAIDDILIANNIASSANGKKAESYNYWWSWQDAAGGIEKNLERRNPDSSSLLSLGRRKRQGDRAPEEPMTVFGFTCGPTLCGVDTTK